MAGGHKPVLSSVGITLTVNARSKQPELAFEMIKAITGAWGKIEYTRNLGLSPNGPISADAIAYQMQSLKDPLYPEFLKLQPTGTTRVIFTPAVVEAVTQGLQALIPGVQLPAPGAGNPGYLPDGSTVSGINVPDSPAATASAE